MTVLADLAQGIKRAVATNSQTWPAFVPVRVIQPGLAKYTDPKGLNGTVLIEKPTLDKMAPTLRGRPVIDQVHKDAKPENFKELADGLVFRVWFEPADGWYWAELAVWDEMTLNHCQDPSYFVSCAYEPTEVNQKGGKHNNVDYDAEFLNGEYTHIAIVKDPRYEGAIIDREHIVFNSKGKGEDMNLLSIFTRKTVENKMDSTTAYTMHNGKKVMLSALMEGYRADRASEEEKKNALPDDAEVDIDGEKVKVKNLIERHLIRSAAQNSDPKHDHKDSENCGKGCPAHNAKNEKEDEKKEDKKDEKKDEEKANNGIEGEAQKEAGAKTKEDVGKDVHADPENDEKKKAENALGEKKDEEPGKHIEEFKEHVENRGEEFKVPSVISSADRLALGRTRYGKKPGGA